jgi:protein-S-isoprenylcysteine O-methyltransferase Ste14
MLFLAMGFIVLMVSRARLEEELLTAANPGYREYINYTGFLFPRFGLKPASAGFSRRATSN